eukprot:TRINITY_DN10761_c0_g1_i1.p1 TRINITY_DN10761_c0_g1~~TRINITY_DN10761_c0_g1_i1.p1  ORF type:complete len:368 (+),score=90.00 TRINITY_DN10761_c0_g1_i1:55-1158(+)
MGDGADFDDSNIAGIGTEEDKRSRERAAATEAAWAAAGTKPGIEVWRIEKFKVKPWPLKEYGNFYKGDSYIVLHTQAVEGTGGQFEYDIHFWLGSQTSTDEMGTAAYKSVELDDLKGGTAHQHRELEHHESPDFQKMFSKLTYLEGGVESGFHHVAKEAYVARLLHVKRSAHNTRTYEVPLMRDSMCHGDCYILDAGTKIFKWFGDEASAFEKQACGVHAENIEATRHGLARTMMWDDDPDEFWMLLGGQGDIAAGGEPKEHPKPLPLGAGILFEILEEANGTKMIHEVKRGGLTRAMLDSRKVYIIDAGRRVFVWLGSSAPTQLKREGMSMATQFLAQEGKPVETPVTIIKDGANIRNRDFAAIVK